MQRQAGWKWFLEHCRRLREIGERFVPPVLISQAPSRLGVAIHSRHHLPHAAERAEPLPLTTEKLCAYTLTQPTLSPMHPQFPSRPRKRYKVNR